MKPRKQFPDIESQYSFRNIKENYLKDKVMSGFSTLDQSAEPDDGLTNLNTTE